MIDSTTLGNNFKVLMGAIFRIGLARTSGVNGVNSELISPWRHRTNGQMRGSANLGAEAIIMIVSCVHRP